MAFAGGRKLQPGLDQGADSVLKARKKKTDQTKDAGGDLPEAVGVPTIRPGERMSDFAARVDNALPVGGLITKTVRDGKDPLGLKVWRTKKERKMHKLYDEWREEDSKIRERKEELLELDAERELEDDRHGVSWNLSQQSGGKGKKKRAGMPGEIPDGEADSWAELKRKRGEVRVGLHDVVQAPPDLKLQKPAKKFSVRGAVVDVDGVPRSAGSLRRREELQGVRDDVVASYRRMMDQRQENNTLRQQKSGVLSKSGHTHT